MTNRRPSPPSKSARTRYCVRALCLIAIATPPLQAQRLTVHTRAAEILPASSAVDLGQLPVSEPLTLTVRLQPSPAQAAALAQLLAAQTDATSPAYHHWLSAQQFAEQFGPTGEQLSALTSYLQAQGLDVSAISPAHTRLTVTGTAGQAQRAFSTSLRRVSIGNTPFFANATEPGLPSELAGLVAGIDGLDNLPQPTSARIRLGVSTSVANPRALALKPTPSDQPAAQPDDFALIADTVDANSSPVLTLSTTACSSDITQSETSAYRSLFRQASAQGITVLATSSCQTSAAGGFPPISPR